MTKASTSGNVLLAFFSRFVAVLTTTFLGTVAGVYWGAQRAMADVAANTSTAKPTFGMESSGLLPGIIWAIDLALGAAVGTVIGLVIGTVGMVIYRRLRKEAPNP